MNKALHLFSLLFCTILLCSCATAYQPMGESGGFYHRKVEENIYIIGFNGNGFTNSKRVNDFALLRAAEIGSRLGYTHFVVEGSIDRSQTELVDMGTTTTSSGRVSEHRNSTSFQSTSTTTNNTYRVYRPGVEIKAVYSEGPPKGRNLEVYAVEEVLRDIRTRYDIKP